MLRITQFGEVTRFDLARTLAGRGRYWTSAYLIDGTLVDSGCAHSARELAHALKDTPLLRIVNTHSHEDHIGANARLQSQHDGLPILAHPLALPVLADPRSAQPLQLYRRLLWGWPEPSKGEPVFDGTMIETDRYRFRVMHTPGHGADHICLYEPDRKWLFTGDLFVGGRDRALRADFDIWQIIASLKHVAELEIVKLFPGSARVRENPAQELEAKIAYLEQLGERVLELRREGRGVGAIARELCGRPMTIELITGGHFSRRRLVSSYLTGTRDG